MHPVAGPAGQSSSSPTPAVGLTLADLNSSVDPSKVRSNEGEAANYGVYFDDTEYDYMQHLRDLGSGGGEAHFVESKSAAEKGKAAKGKRLEDMLREVDLDGQESFVDDADSRYGDSVAGSSRYGGMSTMSSYSRKPTYQDQQNVPDSIAGFRPDMDPRLREVLEALEDDAYAEGNDGDDIFESLVDGNNGEEVDPGEWEDSLFEDLDDDEGWDSDVTEKAAVQPSTSTGGVPLPSSTPQAAGEAGTPEDSAASIPDPSAPPPDMEVPEGDDSSWLREYAKFKKDNKKGIVAAADNTSTTGGAANAAPSVVTATTAYTQGGTPIPRRKKPRKGALTNPSAYSMTSSALARTDGLRLLDDRFEKIEALYSLDEYDEEAYDDTASMASGMSKMSRFSTASRFSTMSSASNFDKPNPSFDAMMDDFLESTGGVTSKSNNHWADTASSRMRGGHGRGKLGKNGNEKKGMKMLDEVRSGLGPARFGGKK